MSDAEFAELQNALMNNPKAGEVIRGAGGLRKVRVMSSRRGKGKRGGSRVIYYWHFKDRQFWLFSIYGKDEMTDLSDKERRILKSMLDAELAAREFED